MVRLIFVSAMLCTSTLVFSSPVYYDGLPRDSTGPRAMAMGDRYSASSETYTCDAKNFTYIEMAGYGTLPAAFVDKFGDTLSTGSGTAVTDWKTPDRGKSYTATVWALPDRGWNTEGTTAYQPRIHRLSLTFTIPTSFPPRNEPLKNLVYKYEDTILFTDPLGIPFAGLDPTTTLKYPGFPDLPAAKFTGDGFGGEGKGGTRACIDPEDFVLSEKGGFWVSDEYGPFIYHFTATGKLDMAIRPPNALIPLRKGKESFSSNSPPRYNRKLKPDPARPSSGRNNNQGFEGLTFSRKENALYTMLQSASINDGGANKTNSRYVRLLKYALDRNGKNPKLDGEWVVPLPVFVEKQPLKGPTVPVDPTPMVAPASAIHALEDGRFLVLARDSDRGRGLKKTKSIYRHVDVFSLHNATDIQGKFDDYTSSFAPGGKLLPRISPAKYCSFLDMNLNAELSRFGVSNGGDVDDRENIGLLNEKWEGLAVVPVFGMSKEYFVFVSSDNDFVTQQGHFNFGKDEYRDKSGLDLENQNLVFRIRIE